VVFNKESNGAQLSSIKVVEDQPCSAVASCSHSTSSFEACSDVLDNVAKSIRKAPDRLVFNLFLIENYQSDRTLLALSQRLLPLPLWLPGPRYFLGWRPST
jgi:hypothetical protein